ncbi:MAG: hypothetical protein AB7T31_10910 [Gemmatimonadales bacterium]
MKRSHALTSAIVLGLVVAGCSDDGTDIDATAPTLPAAESMEMDLSFFESGGSPAPGRAPSAVAGANWFAAAASVAVANLAVVVHTAIPLATWRAAAAQQPVQEDGQWHWRFSTQEDGQTYGGDLTGFVEDGDLIAEMRITASALGLEDFLWYVGVAPVGGTTGTWTFYDPQSPSTVVGMIEWSHPGTLVWTVSFEALAGSGDGDVLTYEVNGASRSVSFSDASEGTTVDIDWNASTHVGSITAPNFNGGVKACWDATLANTTCP